jgi:hypothetical protein
MLTDMLHKFDESKRAVANLMARENITVQVVSGADTAKFNPTTRVLIVPNWVGLTVEQCDLLMSHEIGHALFTDRKMDLSKISKGLFTYLNIIEDARIERKMKAAFPGIGPTFFKGYREFHANGPILKGTTDSLINPKTNEDVKIASMKLIDRINLYYKIGAFAKCPISADEAKWIARIDRATSTDDCLAIARDMHREQKELDKKPQPKNNPSHKPEKQPKQGQTEQGDDQDGDQESSSGAKQDDSKEKDAKDQDAKGDEDGAEGDEDGDDQGSNSDGDEDGDEDGDDSEAAGDESDEDADEKADAPSKGDDQDGDDQDGDDQDGDKPAPADEPTTPSDGTSDEDSDPSADTSDMTEEALKDIASKTPGESPVVHIVYPVLTDEVMKNRTITARAWTLDALEAITAANGTEADLDALEADWNSKYLATAKHMALEFERRKMAKQMIASTTAKSGKLDLSKLAQYRFTDDLFKRSVNVPNGKSHGVVMLIDGSGSMAGVFANVIDQTLLFAHFAYQVNIPFEAYMFSDVTSWKIDANGNREGHFNQISQGINTLTLNETGVLVGLVNTTADRTMFKKNVRALLAVRARYDRSRCLSAETSRGIDNIPYSGLNGTPLFNGVMIAERHLARMKQQQRLDKTTFIVITDGEDTAGLTYESNDRPKYASTTDGPHFADLNGPFVVRDAVTKKNLTFVRTAKNYNGIETAYQPHNAVLTMLLDIIKLRHDSRNVYIYLQPGGRRSSYRRYYRGNVRRNNYSTDGLNYLVRTGKEDLAAQLDRSAILESLKTDGQYVLPVTVGVADLAIMLPVGSVMLTENEFKGLDTSDLTQKKIAAEFTKSMVKAVSNRKFVNSIVPFLI